MTAPAGAGGPPLGEEAGDGATAGERTSTAPAGAGGPLLGEEAGDGATAGERTSTAPAGAGGPPLGEEAVDLVALLPHRAPFLFVDRVDGCSPGESCVARYRVTGDEPFLAGHFPGNPIVPGVIQLEALAQVGAIALRADRRYADRLPLFGGVEKARFRRMVLPGDELLLEVIITRLASRGGWGDARASVEGRTACDARIFFTFAAGS